ncbi:MAG: twin-arginine translocase TatA/TatE family subunit [Pirellulales bacterium]|nr:twin-arginine translocase TatA/TatE family subunit [Pirellulales bacterium]
MIASLLPSTVLLAFWSPGPPEMLLVLVIALLLYGGKLPEVARSWGKTFAEFRRSLSGIQNEINDAIYSDPAQLEYRDDSYQPAGYDEPEDEPADEVAEEEPPSKGEPAD